MSQAGKNDIFPKIQEIESCAFDCDACATDSLLSAFQFEHFFFFFFFFFFCFCFLATVIDRINILCILFIGQKSFRPSVETSKCNLNPVHADLLNSGFIYNIVQAVFSNKTIAVYLPVLGLSKFTHLVSDY